MVSACEKQDDFWNLNRSNKYDAELINIDNEDLFKSFKIDTFKISTNDIQINSADINVKIILQDNFESNFNISSYGLCYSNSPSPSISDNKMVVGNSNSIKNINNIILNFQSLQSGIKYYFRGYINVEINGKTYTIYSNEIGETTFYTFDKIDCESLISFTDSAYGKQWPPQTLPKWKVGFPAKVGNGFLTNAGAYGGYIEFNRTFQKKSKMSLWILSFEGGGYWINQKPNITIDGLPTEIKTIDGIDNANWIKILTKNTISIGNHFIRIEFPYYERGTVYHIDEIEFLNNN